MCLCITLCLQPPRTYCSCAASEFAKEDQNQPTRQTNKSLRATLLAFHILSHDVHKSGVLRSVRWASPFTSESVSKEVKTDGGGHHPWDPSPRITPASCSTSSILSHSLLATHPVGWSSLQVVFLPCPNYDLNAYFLPNKRVGKSSPCSQSSVLEFQLPTEHVSWAMNLLPQLKYISTPQNPHGTNEDPVVSVYFWLSYVPWHAYIKHSHTQTHTKCKKLFFT